MHCVETLPERNICVLSIYDVLITYVYWLLKCIYEGSITKCPPLGDPVYILIPSHMVLTGPFYISTSIPERNITRELYTFRTCLLLAPYLVAVHPNETYSTSCVLKLAGFYCGGSLIWNKHNNRKKAFTKETMNMFLSSGNCGWVFKMSRMPITDKSWFNSRLLQETFFFKVCWLAVGPTHSLIWWAMGAFSLKVKVAGVWFWPLNPI